jgi:hypothetical protein
MAKFRIVVDAPKPVMFETNTIGELNEKVDALRLDVAVTAIPLEDAAEQMMAIDEIESSRMDLI